MPRAMSQTFSGSPSWRRFTTSCRELTLDVITGVPKHRLQRRPEPSYSDGKTKASAATRGPERVSNCTKPRNRPRFRRRTESRAAHPGTRDLVAVDEQLQVAEASCPPVLA